MDKPLARPGLTLAVVMERIAQPNAWEQWAHRAVEVLADEGQFGGAPRLLRDDGRCARWLHPGLRVELFADEWKGYHLNLTSGRPVWFVFWRRAEGDAAMARPEAVSLSYIEADRWMSAEEKVDSLPLPEEVAAWLRGFTDAHFQPEGPRRQRAQSFLSPEQRAQHARRPPRNFGDG